MSYKGHDLDLRLADAGPLPEEMSRAPGQSAEAGARPSQPMAVDPILLDCCNAAFEVARVHGAREIRLEHLLHTLTRVPAASAVLEDLGIRVDQLRRQTAVAIAAEPPGAPADADSTPAASAPFEEVLRRAAGEARKERSAATLPDVLRALLESPAAILLRQAGDPQRLARWREETSRKAAPPAAITPAAPPPAAGIAADPVPAIGDAVLKRLDALEASFQSLQASLAADRAAMSDALRDLRTELATLRASPPSAGDATPRSALDETIEAKLGELGRAATAFSERSAGIDRLLAGNPWEEVRARVEAVEGRVASGNAAGLATLSAPVADLLAQAEANLQHLREETERQWAAATERQQALEASVRAQMEKADEARKSNHDVLSAIYDALLKLGTNQHELGEHFNAWRSETSGDLGIISSRVDQLDHAALDMLSQLSDDLHALQQKNGVEGARLSENLKRWLHGTSNILATTWRKGPMGAYDRSAPPDETATPPSPEAVLSRTPDPEPAEKPIAPGEGARPS